MHAPPNLHRQRDREGDLENLSVFDTTRALKQAHVVAMVAEAEATLTRQDLSLAGMVLEEGKGLVLVLNKCDIASDMAKVERTVSHQIATGLPRVRKPANSALTCKPARSCTRWQCARSLATCLASPCRRSRGAAWTRLCPPCTPSARPRTAALGPTLTRPRPSFSVFDRWRFRVGTGELNAWFECECIVLRRTAAPPHPLCLTSRVPSSPPALT